MMRSFIDREGIVKNPRDGVKILGNGELTKKLTVQVKCIQRICKGERLRHLVEQQR